MGGLRIGRKPVERTKRQPTLALFLIMQTMKTLAILAAIIGSLALLPEDMPTAAPYEPTDNPAQRVREFIRGDRSTLEDADLYAPSVPEPLRTAAKNLID